MAGSVKDLGRRPGGGSLLLVRARRRAVVAGLGALCSTGLLGAACGPLSEAPTGRSAPLAGTFDLLGPAEQPVWGIDEALLNTFQERTPGVKVNHVAVAGGIMVTIPVKIQAMAAAGSGADGYLHYGESWRSSDAANVMLALTPQLFKRNELEKVQHSQLLDTVWARKKEVYFLPALTSVGGSVLLYNPRLLAGAGIDPTKFATWDDVISAAKRLTTRDGAEITQAGLSFDERHTTLRNFILDQGASFFDEKTGKWNWQTAEAERGMQWLLDIYDQHRIAWRQAPSGVKDALGEGRLAMRAAGAHVLSGYVSNFPEVDWRDRPLPAYASGRSPHYWIRRIAGYSLAPWLKPDSQRAQIGAAFLRMAFSPDGAMLIADNYTGGILIKGAYADPRFEHTRYGAKRTYLERDVLQKTVTSGMAAVPDAEESAIIEKVIAREIGIKAGLAEMQQLFTDEQEKANRNRG